MNKQTAKPNCWQTLPGIITAVRGLLTAIAALVVALNQVGLFPPSPSHSQTAARPVAGAAVQSLSDILKRYTYKFGWTQNAVGSIDRDSDIRYYPVPPPQLPSDTFVVLNYRRPPRNGEIRATWSDHKLSGTWNDVDGGGELEIVFNDAYSRAMGWWNRGGQTQRYNAFMRRIQ